MEMMMTMAMIYGASSSEFAIFCFLNEGESWSLNFAASPMYIYQGQRSQFNL